LDCGDARLVLMAEDDEDDCVLAKDAFKESKAPGCLQCVEDGIELLDYLLRSGGGEQSSEAPLPAVILLDLNMPRKDGRQALREIKANPSLQRIPVVVLTTSQEEKDIAFSREMGADSFITKPASFAEWVAIMRALAENWLGT
jgi:CheY-like chemotaxis protein